MSKQVARTDHRSMENPHDGSREHIVNGLAPVVPRRREFLGWYHGGHLPHFDCMHQVQSITFRLADSLPVDVLRRIERELAALPESGRKRERRIRAEHWLDAGLGCCALGHPRVAETMEDALLKFHGDRYLMLAWCIMPNHVHTLIDQLAPLRTIVGSWKSYTGKWAIGHDGELGLGIPGVFRKDVDGQERVPPGSEQHFWMRDYWDRYIRNEMHLENTRRYIHENPVQAGLCVHPEDWPWSSARFVL